MDTMGNAEERDLRLEVLRQRYPGTATHHFKLTSPEDKHYNCVAFAAGDTRQWWSSDPFAGLFYWPEGAPREYTVHAWTATFSLLGYTPCDSDALEVGREKIAIYADGDYPTHVARQLPSGLWTSKLGKREDVEHELPALVGTEYGRVAMILSRPKGGQEVFEW
jgi:hypothetical protein